ncbi:MAG: alpha/beta hydrolase [Clostridia bacterium]|nr:alpha/beta hydrolase [Clostridia bacterium]MBQ7090285.1 alpha/beta hydrolase [Clostridia bacterium]
MKKHKKRWISLISVAVVLALSAGGFFWYVSDYYEAEAEAIAAFAAVNTVPEQATEDGALVYAPEDATAGLIFYPGGKVEHTAYRPLMQACAERGILCVLVEMPFHLAVFDINAADGIREQFPQITDWYIGGHSLGGAMAASYLSDHTEEYKGLILLGAYSTADLSESGVEVLSVYGQEDRVLNKEKYQANLDHLPDDFTEYVIEGGCHAYFGMYGQQDGDGTPTITQTQQICQTADLICAFAQ